MGKFVARSGRVVKPQPDGSIRFGLGIGYLGRAEAMDAEEYFQAKRDAELGRWRWPENPHYVVYPKEGDRVTVADENDGFGSQLISRASVDRNTLSAPDSAVAAARAYFETHPERKPWEAAEPGEAWAVTETNGEALYRVTRSGRFEQVSGDDGLLSMPITHFSIETARRVWPEDAS